MTHRGVLFDLDGVLVLSEHLKAAAHAGATTALGGHVSPEFYRTVMGEPHEIVRRAFLEKGGIAEADPGEYTRIYRKLSKEYLRSSLVVTPGVPELVGSLRKRGYLLAVVSSSSAATVEMTLEAVGLRESFDARVTSDDVERRKPAPDLFLKAMEMLFLSASSTVAFEDSSTGMRAARSAGLKILAVRHAYNTNLDFHEAERVFDSLADTAMVINAIREVLAGEG